MPKIKSVLHNPQPYSEFGIDVVEKLEKHLVEEITKSINKEILNTMFFEKMKEDFQRIRRDKTIDYIITGSEFIHDSGIIDELLGNGEFDEKFRNELKEKLINFIEGK